MASSIDNNNLVCFTNYENHRESLIQGILGGVDLKCCWSEENFHQVVAIMYS